jgi:ABC-type dipeptide/oligopeptide/nickel transport system permease component
MIAKIILTLFALVLVSAATLVFFVSRFENSIRKHRPELAYTTETVPEKEENHCKDYVNIYEIERLKEYYTCYKKGDLGYKLNFLRHVLTITEYENTLAKNGS